jgi:mono/diheme cytochrome c family protein/DNA-binding beta-propeller fold protein YncE
MIRRAILATTLVTFLHTGAALILAGPSPNAVSAGPSARKRYLNPIGVAVSADGRRAYVALSGVAAVGEVDLVTGRMLRRFDTGRHPREVRRDGAVLTVIDDEPGALLIALPNGESRRVARATDNTAVAAVPLAVVIPADRKKDGSQTISLSVRHEPAWQHDALSRSVTEAVFENHLTANLNTGLLNAGTAFTGALGFAGGNNQTGYGGIGPATLRATLDRNRTASAQATAIVWDRPFNTVFVAAGGSDTVLGLSPDGLRTNLKAEGLPRPPVGLIRFRLPTQSNPRAMALSDDGRTLVVSNMLSDSLTVVAVGPGGAQVVKHIPLGGPAPDAARRGEVLFHSARLSFNGRFACSSCHPGGGSDANVWLTPTEDAGFERSTKPLFGLRDTAPYGWRGDSPTLVDRVQKTLTKLHKHSPKKSEVRDLVAFLESLEPPEPALVAEEEKESVQRGRELFEGRARCSRCHTDERLCDGKRHDVGTGGLFDTPSLRGVRNRWLLLHDGRANGPGDIFQKSNQQQKHGAAHELDACDFDDLMAYLKTL